MQKTPDSELVAYIDKHLKKGFKIGQIRKRLRAAGHPKDAIDAALKHLGYAPHNHVLVYSIIIVLALAGAGFIFFVGFTAQEVAEYQEDVQEFEQNQTYKGMTDVQLIMAAKAGDDKACEHITSHNIYYACRDKYWERDDCSYELVLGTYDECVQEVKQERKTQAIENSDQNLCYFAADTSACYDNIIMDMDVSECDTDYCKGRMALIKQDPSICSYIDVVGMRDACMWVASDFAKAIEDCHPKNYICQIKFVQTADQASEIAEKMIQDNPDIEPKLLRLRLAVISGDVDSCSYFQDTYTESGLSDVSFMNVCNFFKATQEDDPELACGRLSNQEDIALCSGLVVNDICTGPAKVCSFFDRGQD